METERFEALIDAILAIIITIIVLEILLASNGSWEALFEIKYEFAIYAISFIVCFNFWNYNNNTFSIVNKIDPKVIWTMGITLFVFSLLPYLTTFVAENFYIFFPQFLYGLCFIVTAILSKLISKIPEGIRSCKHCTAIGFRKRLHICNDHRFSDYRNDYRIFRLSSGNNHLLSIVNHCNVDSSKIKKSIVISFI